jgi:hypothetical protein
MSAQAAIRAAKRHLRGTWRSDKARSIAQWKFSKPITDKRRRVFASIFGKNVWRFGPNTCRGKYEDRTWTARYRVLWADEHSAVVQFRNGDGTRCHHLFFEGNHFYFAAGYAGSVEYFKRMPSNSALLSDASTSPLRAQRSAAKRGR